MDARTHNLKTARRAMEKARAELNTRLMLDRLTWLSGLSAVASLLSAIVLNAINIITDGTSWGLVGAMFVFAIVCGCLIAYVHDEKDGTITDARHAWEDAQDHYYEVMQA